MIPCTRVEPTATVSQTSAQRRTVDATLRTTLIVLWSRGEPSRIGEIIDVFGLAPDQIAEFGRGQLGLLRQRPNSSEQTGPLQSATISRRQLAVRSGELELELENVGRGTLLVNDVALPRACVRPGDLVELDRRMLLLCVQRPAQLPGRKLDDSLMMFGFGEADHHGIVGESPAIWALRSRIQFVARRQHHALILGPSGTGKELIAQAIHGLSCRSNHNLISRNAATIPPTLIDAELFGNLKDYPNPGMRERAGLIGAAHGSTLFLDEIGELSHEAQAHLLRVMEIGEYQRLGESRPRVADLRVLAASNRDAGELKHDLLARFVLRVQTPGLTQHREDIPLLVRHLLERIAEDDSELNAEFVDATVQPSLAMIKQLVRRAYVGHVREVKALLWEALANYHPPSLELSETPHEGQVANEPDPREALEDHGRAESPSSAALVAALEASGWVLEQAWRRLGLRNRHQLRRLMQRHGVSAPHVHVDPSTLTPRDVVAALAHCDGVKERAWRQLGLRSRHQLDRLLQRHALENDEQ